MSDTLKVNDELKDFLNLNTPKEETTTPVIKGYDPSMEEVERISRGMSSNFQNVTTNVINIADIEVNAQVRKTFKEEEIEELSSSIKTHGLLTPITVVEEQQHKFRLICGEKRLRACKKLGLTAVKANVITLKPTDISIEAQILVLQIVENLQRSNPSLNEVINAVEQLVQTNPNINAKKISELLSKKEKYAYTMLKIAEYSPNEKLVVIPLGYSAINNVYNPLKRNFPKKAEEFIDKTLGYIENCKTDGRDVDYDGIKKALQKLYENCLRKKSKVTDNLAKDAETTKKGKGSVTLAKLDKIRDGVGKRFEQYLKDTESDFDEGVATAIDFFLDSLKK